MRRTILILSLAAVLQSCATTSHMVKMGPDTFMLSKQAGTGFSGASTLKAEVIEEAGEYCTKSGKKIRVVNSTEAQPPYVLGNYPHAEVQFMCLNAEDPELTRPR